MIRTRTSSNSLEYLKNIMAAAGFAVAPTASLASAQDLEAALADCPHVLDRDDDRRAERANQTFRPSQNGWMRSNSTFVGTDDEVADPGILDEKVAFNETLAVIRDFEKLDDGWDGPGSMAPKHGVIEDAKALIQSWSTDLPDPEPVMAFDGNLVLEMFDERGFTRGGIEFIGDHCAIFTVIERAVVKASNEFDTTSQSEILTALAAMKRALI